MNIQSIKSRLIHLIDNRAFYFKDTKKEVAERYLNELKNFKGISESERVKLEIQCRGRFPRSFKKFLKEMGASCGQLFYGCDLCPGNTSQEEMRIMAESLFEDQEVESFLQPSDFIFVFYQGISFYYIQAEGERNSAVYLYDEDNLKPVKEADSFDEFLEKKVVQLEAKHLEYVNSGGYSLTLSEEGYMSMMFGGADYSSPFATRDEFL